MKFVDFTNWKIIFYYKSVLVGSYYIFANFFWVDYIIILQKMSNFVFDKIRFYFCFFKLIEDAESIFPSTFIANGNDLNQPDECRLSHLRGWIETHCRDSVSQVGYLALILKKNAWMFILKIFKLFLFYKN